MVFISMFSLLCNTVCDIFWDEVVTVVQNACLLGAAKAVLTWTRLSSLVQELWSEFGCHTHFLTHLLQGAPNFTQYELYSAPKLLWPQQLYHDSKIFLQKQKDYFKNKQTKKKNKCSFW